MIMTRATSNRFSVPEMHTVGQIAVLQPLRWCCVDCVIHHERDVRKEQKYMYVARTSNNRVISSGDLYYCLLPRCEALRTCRSGFPIATAASHINISHQNQGWLLLNEWFKSSNKNQTNQEYAFSKLCVISVTHSNRFATCNSIEGRKFLWRHKSKAFEVL